MKRVGTGEIREEREGRSSVTCFKGKIKRKLADLKEFHQGRALLRPRKKFFLSREEGRGSSQMKETRARSFRD